MSVYRLIVIFIKNTLHIYLKFNVTHTHFAFIVTLNLFSVKVHGRFTNSSVKLYHNVMLDTIEHEIREISLSNTGHILEDRINVRARWRFYKRNLDVQQSRKNVTPSEGQTHYSVVIGIVKHAF